MAAAAAAAAAPAAQISSCFSSANKTPALCEAKIGDGVRYWLSSLDWEPFSRRNCKHKLRSVGIRCERRSSKQSNGAAVWLGRLAMVGFASAITVEVVIGKGLLENSGVLTAVFIFQSASDK